MGNGFKIGDRVFCCYLNDDDLKREGFFEIADLNENSFTFKTRERLFLIPINRILKVKLEGTR